jgi:hypothetical protein
LHRCVPASCQNLPLWHRRSWMGHGPWLRQRAPAPAPRKSRLCWTTFCQLFLLQPPPPHVDEVPRTPFTSPTDHNVFGGMRKDIFLFLVLQF